MSINQDANVQLKMSPTPTTARWGALFTFAWVRTRRAGHLVIVFALCLALFLPFAHLDVDPHHDGVVVTPAIAAANGLSIHGDVFSQYGVVSHQIQALTLWIFGENLLTVRLLSAVALAFAVSLFFWASQRMFGSWVAVSSTGVWLSVTPFFESTMLPWSSDLALLVQGLAFVSIVSAARASRDQHKLIGVAGFLVGLLPFLRINTGLASVLAFLIAVYFLLHGANRRFALLGLAIGSLYPTMYLVVTGSVDEFIDQNIVFPRYLYLSILGDSGFSGLRANITVNGVPAAAFMIACVWLVCGRDLLPIVRSAGTRTDIVVSFLSAGLLLFLTWNVQPNVHGFLTRTNILWGVVALALAVTPRIVSELVLTRSGPGDLLDIRRATIFLGVLGLASLVQVFPVLDHYHVWWASLPMIGFVFSTISKKVDSRLRKALLSMTLLLPLGVDGLGSASTQLNRPRISVDLPGVLHGMMISGATGVDLYMTQLQIQKIESKVGKHAVINLCSDGLYSAMGGNFSLPDPYYVYWPFPEQMWDDAERLQFIEKNSPFIVFCGPTEPLIDVWINQTGYQLIPKVECPNIPSSTADYPWVSRTRIAIPENWAVATTYLSALYCPNVSASAPSS